VLLRRQPLQVRTQDDGPEIGLERLARLEAGGLVGQPALDVDVPGRVEPAGRRQDRFEVDGAQPAVTDRRQHPLDRGDVARPAALGDQPAARPGHRGEIGEERIVVRDPVERGRRQDGVDVAFDRQRGTEIRHDVLDPIAERGKPLSCSLDHGRRAVERDDAAVR
jgi:hypothetical protein